MSPGDTIHIVIPQSNSDSSVSTSAATPVTSTTSAAPTAKEMREYYEKQENEGAYSLTYVFTLSFTYLFTHSRVYLLTYSIFKPLPTRMLQVLVVIKQKESVLILCSLV